MVCIDVKQHSAIHEINSPDMAILVASWLLNFLQNKRVQISINREKEFIKTRNPKENDKEMNHLDRR